MAGGLDGLCHLVSGEGSRCHETLAVGDGPGGLCPLDVVEGPGGPDPLDGAGLEGSAPPLGGNSFGCSVHHVAGEGTGGPCPPLTLYAHASSEQHPDRMRASLDRRAAAKAASDNAAQK